VITGRAALIRANPNAESVAENARRIEEQVERLAQRIRKLIDYLTTSEPDVDPRPADQIAAEAYALYAPIAAQQGVGMRLSESLPASTVDGTSALVVLTSLLSLALRSAPAGGSVELRAEPSRDGVAFELLVPGLAPPATRIDRLDPPEDGVGVDVEQLQVLTVCFAIARRNGGRLEVVPRDSSGSTIRFECPAVSDSALLPPRQVGF
jgi:signal transduction histidine kinase